MKKGNKKPILPTRGTIILMFKDQADKSDIFVAGEGYIDAVKLHTGEYRFTGTLVKNYNNKARNQLRKKNDKSKV